MKFKHLFAISLLLCFLLGMKPAVAPHQAKAQAPVPTPLPAPGLEGPKIDGPAKVELTVPRVKAIAFKANCKLKYVSADKDLEIVFATDDTCVVQALKPGQTYRLFVIGGKGDQVDVKTVEVVTAGDAPPAPAPPAPVPVPPVPPAPAPSALAAELGILYVADPDPAKQQKALALARVYTSADDALKKATAGEVIAALKARSAAEKLEAGDLAAIRDRIGKELAAVLPRKSSDPVTDAQRKALSDLFLTVSTTLRVVRSAIP